MLDALVERCPVTERAVVHLKGLAGNREPLCHAQDRCDPNAASEQHAGFCLVREREMILGALIVSTSPSFTCSCMAFEPPRVAASFSTPILYRPLSKGALQSEYWRVSPFGKCTSICEPAENGGSGLPPMSIRSKLQTSTASTAFRATRTCNVPMLIQTSVGLLSAVNTSPPIALVWRFRTAVRETAGNPCQASP